VRSSGSGGVNCFSQDQCPGAAMTWCFNLYHPSKHIEICFNESTHVVSASREARLLGLASHFIVGKVRIQCKSSFTINYIHFLQDCRYSSDNRNDNIPCIHFTSVPYFFNGGLLTCASQNESCSSNAYIQLLVKSELTCVYILHIYMYTILYYYIVLSGWKC